MTLLLCGLATEEYSCVPHYQKAPNLVVQIVLESIVCARILGAQDCFRASQNILYPGDITRPSELSTEKARV